MTGDKTYVTCMTVICNGRPTCGADIPTASYLTNSLFISSTTVLMNTAQVQAKVLNERKSFNG